METTTEHPKRYGAYHRVSDANGRATEDETTITEKVAFEQIDGWAKMRRVTIAERYLDWDKTGSKMERPELDRMLADLDAGVIDGIVCAQVDRLSRADVGDALITVKRIIGDDEDHPRSLVLLDIGLDPTTETGELVLGVLLHLARFQWRRYQRQYKTSRARAIRERNAWIGPAPLGYRHAVVGERKDGKSINGGLVRDPATWPVVREAFRVAAADGIHAAAALLERELPAMRWRTSDVRRVLSNRAYLGEHHAGGRPHDAITTPATFQAAQTEPRHRRTNGDYPLSGVATCANCGGELVGGIQAANNSRRMRCSGYNKGLCRGGVSSVPAAALEEYVRDRLAVALADDDFRLSFDPHGSEQAELALEVAEAERARFGQDTEAHELLGDAAWRAGLRSRAAKVAEAREQLQSVAVRAARREQLPLPGELDDPVQFARALAVVGSVVVRGGRGAVAGRVTEFAWAVGDDFDNGAGVLAA